MSNKNTWHKKLPFKWSFCLWITIRNKLPTDDRVIAFGNPTVTRCVCCVKPQAESIDHIFSNGHFVRAIWSKYTCITGMQIEHLPLKLTLMKWWLQQSKNAVHQMLIDTTSTIICWNIWKNIYNAKYGGRPSSMTKVLYSIDSDIQLLFKTSYPHINWPSKWNALYIMVEELKHVTSITKVVWKKP